MPTPSPEPPRHRLFSNGLLISFAIHAVIIGLFAGFAAHEGMLGQTLKQISVRLLPPPAPENLRVPEKPKPELPQEKPAPFAEPAPPKAPALAPPAMSTATPVPVVAAPAPAELPLLAFDDGGKTVQTESDPPALYRSYVEFSLRSRWNRPTDIADAHYVADVEIAVDAAGRISAPRWQRKSGDSRWDATVWEAIAQTKTLDRPPPAGFPARITVRFDVIQTAGLNLP